MNLKPVLWLAIAGLAGCGASAPRDEAHEPARRPIDKFVKEDVRYPIDVYDPWERVNRRMYKFNTKFDQIVFLPVVHVYETITPDLLEQGVSNFFSNLSEIRNFGNSVLQLKPKPAAVALGRFAMNSTLGLGGVLDLATPLDIEQRDEDFGQTLAHYGAGNGPFLVLPILGPSNLRDTIGLAVDAAALQYVIGEDIDLLSLDGRFERELGFSSLRSIDARHNIGFRYAQTGSPFEYDLIRLLYTKMREVESAK